MFRNGLNELLEINNNKIHNHLCEAKRHEW